VAQQAAETA
jgi:hypothetical protein